MKFKLEFTFDISDSSLLIDANDGRSEEYTSLKDGAWEDFVDFFTSEKETASGTPYIDCYDIRELFENGDV